MRQGQRAACFKENGELIFENNCFDYIKLISALMIVLGHASAHLNCPLPGWLRFIQSKWIGVCCLFVISGYLVAFSYERSRDWKAYLKKRILRIYPGLYCAFACSLLAVVIVGIMIFHGNYGGKDIALWSVAQVTFFQFYTPSAMQAYGIGNPNGSLWTVLPEIQMYLIILFSYQWLRRLRIRGWMVLLGACAMLNVLHFYMEGVVWDMVYKLLGVSVLPYLYLFFIGMFVYVQRERALPFLVKRFYWILGIYVAWSVFNTFVLRFEVGSYTDIITGVLLALCIPGGGINSGRKNFPGTCHTGFFCFT